MRTSTRPMLNLLRHLLLLLRKHMGAVTTLKVSLAGLSDLGRVLVLNDLPLRAVCAGSTDVAKVGNQITYDWTLLSGPSLDFTGGTLGQTSGTPNLYISPHTLGFGSTYVFQIESKLRVAEFRKAGWTLSTGTRPALNLLLDLVHLNCVSVCAGGSWTSTRPRMNDLLLLLLLLYILRASARAFDVKLSHALIPVECLHATLL